MTGRSVTVAVCKFEMAAEEIALLTSPWNGISIPRQCFGMHSVPIPKRYDASMNALSSRQIARSIVRYGIKPAVIAVYFVLLALLWTFPLQPLIAYPFVFLFFGAIVCSAWFCGFLQVCRQLQCPMSCSHSLFLLLVLNRCW
ncbi:MAG TPA: hypothetical protein VHD85_22030 [Terracidiphilus sp.]|nr:hypothetical protein [Terracidiphilus sp.]